MSESVSINVANTSQDKILKELLNQATVTNTIGKDKSSTSPPSSAGPSSILNSFTSAASVNMLMIQAQQQASALQDLLVSLSQSQTTVLPHVRALQDTLSQMANRFEFNSEALKIQMNSDNAFKVEVVTHWGRP